MTFIKAPNRPNGFQLKGQKLGGLPPSQDRPFKVAPAPPGIIGVHPKNHVSQHANIVVSQPANIVVWLPQTLAFVNPQALSFVDPQTLSFANSGQCCQRFPGYTREGFPVDIRSCKCRFQFYVPCPTGRRSTGQRISVNGSTD